MHIPKSLSPAGHRVRLLTVCTTALLALGVTAASPAAADDSVSYTFESPSQKLPFMAINGAGRVLVGPAPGGKGGHAARVNIPNDGRSFKSELVIKGLDAGSHRFGFANYLPGDWQPRDFDTIVTQWFSTQDDTSRIKPVMALSVHGGDWRLKVHWMSGGEIQEKIIPLGAARPGHWNQWTFDITWSTPSTPGSITVTRDGATVGSHQGANNYHRGQPPHFRIGAYRPGWRPEKGPEHRAGSSDAVLYIDDIAITSTAAGSAPAPRPTASGGAASPTRTPAATPSPTATGSPSASPSTKAGTAPSSGARAAAAAAPASATPRATASDGSSLPSTGSAGVIGIGLASAAALAGGAFFLMRRHNGTRPNRGAHRR
ncbi:heparin lyase I family protein [Streptomyces ficellus]|uniref:LPXTG cell wall anchor domain-containing protein n=1 Tax=Streptomyces ficellus TaxID=1977088 RepID=A0A6I6FD10_9ACTN|nr:heparin lyase I family protein [Streptomyces ficellus]QGV77025.1 LPXTG cell wall anchor domain-containing protein [Streptomyces ficellus]